MEFAMAKPAPMKCIQPRPGVQYPHTLSDKRRVSGREQPASGFCRIKALAHGVCLETELCSSCSCCSESNGTKPAAFSQVSLHRPFE